MLWYLLGVPITLVVLWAIVGIVVRNASWWFFIPGGMYAILVSKENVSTDIDKGGGGIVDVEHEVPGKVLNKKSHNFYDWKFEDGKENRGLLHFLYGVHWKGPFRDLRLNIDKSFRFGLESKKSDDTGELEEKDGKEKRKSKQKVADQEGYHVFPQVIQSEYVFFSGQQAVEVNAAETKGAFALDIKYNIIWERIYPVRAILRVADSNATLSEMSEAKTIALTGTHDPDYYLSGTKEAKAELVKEVKDISTAAEEQLGLCITSVTLFSIDPDKKEVGLRALLELAKKTELEQAARLKVATASKQAAITEAEGIAESIRLLAEANKTRGTLENDVSADRVQRVTLAIAREPGAAAIRAAEAYENNKTVTTFAPGNSGGLGIIIPQPAQKDA